FASRYDLTGSTIGLSRARPVLLLGVTQVLDEVRAVGRIGHGEAHLVAGNGGLGIGEPAIQGARVPDDPGRFHRRRVVEAFREAGLAPEYALVRRAGAVLIDRVAADAAALVELLAARGVGTEGK